MKLFITVTTATFLWTAGASAQVSQEYRQAAEVWRNAKCSIASEQTCANQNAMYYDCLANKLGPGGSNLSCSAPACSVSSCNGGSGNAATGGSAGYNLPLANTGNSKIDLAANGITLLLKWRMSRDANKAASSGTPPDANATADTGDASAQETQSEQQRLSDEASQLLADADAVTGASAVSQPDMVTPEAAVMTLLGPDPTQQLTDSSMKIQDLLDTGSPSSSSGTLGGSPADIISSLLDSPAPPQLPTILSLNSSEEQEAESAGFDWAQSLRHLEDVALSDLKKLMPDPMDVTAKMYGLDGGDTVAEQTTGLIRTLLPSAAESEQTMGSALMDMGVEKAGDKMADFIMDKKDEFACSSDSEVMSGACMVLLAPGNTGRGAYGYGKLLIERYQHMMQSVSAEFFPGNAHD